MLCFNLCYGLNIWGEGVRGWGATLYKSVHVICRHLIDNAKIVKVFIKVKSQKFQLHCNGPSEHTKKYIF